MDIDERGHYRCLVVSGASRAWLVRAPVDAKTGRRLSGPVSCKWHFHSAANASHPDIGTFRFHDADRVEIDGAAGVAVVDVDRP